MWKISLCLTFLGLVCDNARGEGDVILSGTLKVTGGTNCLQADGNSVAAVTDNTCVEVVVVETDTAGEYSIQKLEGTRADNKLTLTNPNNAFGVSVEGSTVVFLDVAGNSNLDTAAALTASDTPFVIRKSSDADECLSAAGTYTTGSACNTAADLWYFELAACRVTDCATCVDALVCDACPTNEVVNDGGTACEGCSVVLHPQCTACNQDTGTAACTTCNDGYITHNATGCTACGTGEVSANNVCMGCPDSEIVMNNVCTACKSGQTAHSNRADCVEMCTVDNCLYCDSGADTCDQCNSKYGLDNNVCTDCADNQIVENKACTNCSATETPNTAGDTCVDACTDNNCKYCDSTADMCGQCNDGYIVNDGACDEQTTTTASTESTENKAADRMSFMSVLILALFAGRRMV